MREVQTDGCGWETDGVAWWMAGSALVPQVVGSNPAILDAPRRLPITRLETEYALNGILVLIKVVGTKHEASLLSCCRCRRGLTVDPTSGYSTIYQHLLLSDPHLLHSSSSRFSVRRLFLPPHPHPVYFIEKSWCARESRRGCERASGRKEDNTNKYVARLHVCSTGGEEGRTREDRRGQSGRQEASAGMLRSIRLSLKCTPEQRIILVALAIMQQNGALPSGITLFKHQESCLS